MEGVLLWLGTFMYLMAGFGVVVWIDYTWYEPEFDTWWSVAKRWIMLLAWPVFLVLFGLWKTMKYVVDLELELVDRLQERKDKK